MNIENKNPQIEQTSSSGETSSHGPETQRLLAGIALGDHLLPAETGEQQASAIDTTKTIGHPDNIADQATAAYGAELRAREEERAAAEAEMLSRPVEDLITSADIPSAETMQDLTKRLGELPEESKEQ